MGSVDTARLCVSERYLTHSKQIPNNQATTHQKLTSSAVQLGRAHTVQHIHSTRSSHRRAPTLRTHTLTLQICRKLLDSLRVHLRCESECVCVCAGQNMASGQFCTIYFNILGVGGGSTVGTTQHDNTAHTQTHTHSPLKGSSTQFKRAYTHTGTHTLCRDITTTTTTTRNNNR